MDDPKYTYWTSVRASLLIKPDFSIPSRFIERVKEVSSHIKRKIKNKSSYNDDEATFSFYESKRAEIDDSKEEVKGKRFHVSVEELKEFKDSMKQRLEGGIEEARSLGSLFLPEEAWFFIGMNIALLASFVPQRFPVVSFFFYYQIVKVLVASKRNEGYLGSPYPPTSLANSSNLKFRSYMPKGSAIAVLLVAGAYLGALGIKKVKVSSSTRSLLANINIHLNAVYHYQINYLLLGVLFIYLTIFISYCFYSKDLEGAQREPWVAQQDIYQGWVRHFNDLKINPVPSYIREDEIPITSPLFKFTYFSLATGTNYHMLESKENDLVASLGSTMAMIMPYPMIDGNNGVPIPASINPMIAIVAQATSHLGDSPHTNAFLDKQTLSFAIQYTFRRAFRGLSIPNLIWVGDKQLKILYPQKSNTSLKEQMSKLASLGFHIDINDEEQELSQKDPNAFLIETLWKLPDSLSFDDLAKRSDAIKEKIGVKWLGIGKRENSNFVSIVYGYNPISLALKDGEDKQFMERLEWERILRVGKLLGENGRIPEYQGSKALRAGLIGYNFNLVEGLTESKIRAAQESLASIMQKNFLDIEISKKDFQVTVGDSNPMEEIKLFIDYDKNLIFKPKESPDITFYVGVGLDGDLIKFAHDSELAHLLIGGSSGMGKSTLIHSMLVQLAAKNTPAQWELRIAEPKNEMQRYLRLPHLKRFVDQETNPANPYKAMANMFKELVAEMEGRYALFGKLPDRPQNLAQARATKETKNMYLPYITCLVEECSDYYVKPTLKRYQEDWEQVIFYSGMLIRKARAAGIYLIFATQKPVNDSLPTSIKDNCRRIGFGTSSMTASQVIIGEAGLEKIKVRGQGMVSSLNGYRSFKSFYFREKKEGEPNSTNEIEIYLGKLCTEQPNRTVPALAKPAVFNYVEEQMIMSRLEA
jgi:hypothetical protein